MYRAALLLSWQSKLLDGQPCSAKVTASYYVTAGPTPSPSSLGVASFKYVISRMTAWPAITDSYNNDVTHFSRKLRSPTSFPSFTVAATMVSVTHQRSRRRHSPHPPRDDAVDGGQCCAVCTQSLYRPLLSEACIQYKASKATCDL